MRNVMIGAAVVLLAGLVAAQSFTDVDTTKHQGKTGLKDLITVLDANFALLAGIDDKVAAITVTGADLAAAGTGTITIQLVDAGGNNLAAAALIRTWIGTADDYGVDAVTDYSVGTGTSKEEVTANGEYLSITDTNGVVVMDIDNGGSGTVYAWAEVGGRIVASGALVLTAP